MSHDNIRQSAAPDKHFFSGTSMNFRPSPKSAISFSVKILELRLTNWSLEPIKFKNFLLQAGVLIGPRRVKVAGDITSPPDDGWSTTVH